MDTQPLDIDVSALRLGESSGERAEGLHASDIYGDYYQDFDPKRYRRGGTPPPLLLETGLIIENILEEGLKRRFAENPTDHEQIERPGELTYRDTFQGKPVIIHYNPDLAIFNGVGLRIGEVKATWLSSHIPHAYLESTESRLEHAGEIAEALNNRKLDKFFDQVMFYMKFIGTRYGRFYIFFMAGDYSRPFTSQLVIFNVEFTQGEIDSTFNRLMRHAVSKGMLDVKGLR